MKDKKELRLLAMIAAAAGLFICGKYSNNFYAYLLGNKELIALTASIVTIISLLAIWWPIIIYFEKKNDEKKRILITLRSQLEVLGSWAGYTTGGYSSDSASRAARIDNNWKTWGNPFHQVFKIDTALQTVWIQPGLTNSNTEIINLISPLNQEILSFNAMLEDIRVFKFSWGAQEAIKLHLKLSGINEEKLTEDEVRFAKKLTEMYEVLHSQNIGDDKSGRLHQKHKELYDLVVSELSTE